MPLAKTAPGFKASMNGQWHEGKGGGSLSTAKRQRANTKTMIFGCEYA